MGQIISAPICGIQLALLGAEVIKIERPEGGDEFRYYGDSVGVPGISTSYAAYNAGKKSVVLDLHAEAGGRRSLNSSRTPMLSSKTSATAPWSGSAWAGMTCGR